MGGDAGTLASEEAVIGFLRAAEIKHGRVAMAAFVGFIVQSNGIHFPWDLTTSGISHADIAAAGGPAAQWDALPTASKLQIFGAIGFLEGWGENSKAIGAQGQKHYMRGGKPGFFPSFQVTSGSKPSIHPLPLDLWDPFGLSKKASPEKKEKSLLAEINNGRLAMLGIMAFMAEARMPGAVPGLVGKVTPYSGECHGALRGWRLLAAVRQRDAQVHSAQRLKWHPQRTGRCLGALSHRRQVALPHRRQVVVSHRLTPGSRAMRWGPPN